MARAYHGLALAGTIAERREAPHGLRLIQQAQALRHFTARFELRKPGL